MKLTKIIALIICFSTLAWALDMPYYLFNMKGELNKANLISTVQDIYVRLGNAVDNYSNQSIVGNKTFTNTVVISSSVRFSDGSEQSVAYPGQSFYNRGDVNSYDWTASSFTADYAWHDLDLSAIVPVGTKAVLCYVAALGSTGGNTFELRTNGNTNTFNLSRLTCQSQTANITVTGDFIVPVVTDRIIEYRRDANFTAINVLIKGWWK